MTISPAERELRVKVLEAKAWLREIGIFYNIMPTKMMLRMYRKHGRKVIDVTNA